MIYSKALYLFTVLSITDFKYLEEANIINETLSNKEKLQDALLVLNRMNGPMDLIFLIKNKLKKNKGDLKWKIKY